MYAGFIHFALGFVICIVTEKHSCLSASLNEIQSLTKLGLDPTIALEINTEILNSHLRPEATLEKGPTIVTGACAAEFNSGKHKTTPMKSHSCIFGQTKFYPEVNTNYQVNASRRKHKQYHMTY